MERYFIVIVEEIRKCPKIDKLVEDFKQINKYQHLISRASRVNNAARIPIQACTLDWAICVVSTQRLFKGSGVEQFQELVSSSFIADIPSEAWDSNSFAYLSYYAIDIIIICDECPEFWTCLGSCNSIKIHRNSEKTSFNQQLYWRGSLRIQDPQTPSHFGEMANAELSYSFDELDILISQIRNEVSPLVAKQKKTFCPYLEIVGAFISHKVPYMFYTSTRMKLTVQSELLKKSMSAQQNAFLLRLDYTTQEIDHWEKGVGTQSIFLLSHCHDDDLQLLILKNADELQALANMFVGLQANNFSDIESLQIESAEVEDEIKPLRVDQMERDVRKYQLKALKTWVAQKGSIDAPTMEKLLREVASAVAKRSHDVYAVKDLEKTRMHCDFSEADSLKWKLEKKGTPNEMDRAAAMSNSLPQPSGRLVTVDVNQMLRCLNKKNVMRSPRKARLEPCTTTMLKPNCDLDTARKTLWPESCSLKFHGISYNLSLEDEKTEKQRAEYQDKWVPPDVATSSWCNPWSINSSSSFQLSARGNHSIPSAPSVVPSASAIPEVRTPKKSQQAMRDLAQLRKSPRLLAKTDAASGEATRTTRRTPSKKNPSASAPIPKESFKQQLKAVIIRVLGDQKITPKDPIFRTCANKLSVICMALLKDSKDTVTTRQMFQLAKSQAKQVLQYVKP